jgi:hypothetical protein
MYRLLIPREIWLQLDSHLRRATPNEDGAFLLVRSGRGATGTRLIAHELLLPAKDAWEARGHHRLRPSGQWLSAVIGAAIETDSGVAFVHSHPDDAHPPELSPLDKKTSTEWSRSLTPTLGRPFLSLVWTTAGVRGWVFEADDPLEHRDVHKVEVLGGGRSVLLSPIDELSSDRELDDRQVRALGELGNRRIRDLSVAVVGAGGTGSPLAEQLARMGVRELLVVDPDRIDTSSNLRRIVGSRPQDLLKQSPKVEVVARHLSELGFGGVVSACGLDVRSEDAARRLLDADLVISTTDTHSSRSLVNQLAHQYLLPVIDVGVKVGTSLEGRVTGMPTEIRVLLPDTACLWCSGVLDAVRIRAENLPDDERRQQAREGYVQGVGEPQASLTALNYFASSLALLTMMRLLSGEAIISARTIADGWEHYFADVTCEIDPECICHAWRGMGDEKQVAYLPAPADSSG